ncbi:MAG: helix-turn-helix domain-containing protein [Chloroflexota bacterium]|nr:helix-turn-helix domain-containing protein [Chloroflexota bacterium]
MSEPLLIRPAEAAEILSVSRSKLYSMLPDLPGVIRLPGGSVRILRNVMERWLSEQASDGMRRAPAPAKASAQGSNRVKTIDRLHRG